MRAENEVSTTTIIVEFVVYLQGFAPVLAYATIPMILPNPGLGNSMSWSMSDIIQDGTHLA